MINLCIFDHGKKNCIIEHLSFYTVEHLSLILFSNILIFKIITIEVYTWCYDEMAFEAVSPVHSSFK